MRRVETYELVVTTTATKLRATVTTTDIKRFLRQVKRDCDNGGYVVVDDGVIDGAMIRWVDVLGPVYDGKLEPAFCVSDSCDCCEEYGESCSGAFRYKQFMADD